MKVEIPNQPIETNQNLNLPSNLTRKPKLGPWLIVCVFPRRIEAIEFELICSAPVQCEPQHYSTYQQCIAINSVESIYYGQRCSATKSIASVWLRAWLPTHAAIVTLTSAKETKDEASINVSKQQFGSVHVCQNNDDNQSLTRTVNPFKSRPKNDADNNFQHCCAIVRTKLRTPFTHCGDIFCNASSSSALCNATPHTL